MNITIDVKGYSNEILESLIKKGVVKTKSEAIRLGLLYLNDKYLSDNDRLERLEYNFSVEKRFMKDWEKEPKGVWESYLDEK